ncbi:MAG: DUF378 domain-containing protein [Clostridia bacterium]|nr:DUF378 domain-containing protein [Clostridia bacterium]
MIIANNIALSIAIICCLNWFLVGVFSWNLVTWIFGVGLFTRIIYAIVGIAGIWLLIQLVVRRTRLFNSEKRTNNKIND